MSTPLGTMLRPYLHGPANPLRRNLYLRFYSAARPKASSPSKSPKGKAPETKADEGLWSTRSYKQRLVDLKGLRPASHNGSDEFPASLYPRMPGTPRVATQTPGEGSRSVATMHIRQVRQAYDHLVHGAPKSNHAITIQGKVTSLRAHSRRLMFVDVVQEDVQVQVMFNMGQLEKLGYASASELDRVRKEIHVGDWYQFSGYPFRTRAGELSLSIDTFLPILLTPALHSIPASITDETTLSRFPQLDLLTQRKKRDLLRLRHHVELVLQQFLNDKGFTKVSTPILAADTGGAVARPFETSANYDGERTGLRLRIAHELGLKELVQGGLGKVYEVGPVFRNEGLDATHNPEFTICEFYQPYATLDDLMAMTEDLLCSIHSALAEPVSTHITTLQEPHGKLSNYFQPGTTFRRLPFLPTLLDQLNRVAPGFRLPQKLDEEAIPEILALFEELKLAVPANATVARLLDALSGEFVEPLCKAPTFITHYPSIMSPLSKSFIDAETGHTVSARAELFIDGVEYANMYEEENDPFAQAEKFLLQGGGAEGEDGSRDRVLADIYNEGNLFARSEAVRRHLTPGQRYYVRVLECGMPPTGGWGCGIDRVVMLFGGASRIADVLPFGNLRGVVAMGTDVTALKREGQGRGKLVEPAKADVHHVGGHRSDAIGIGAVAAGAAIAGYGSRADDDELQQMREEARDAHGSADIGQGAMWTAEEVTKARENGGVVVEAEEEVVSWVDELGLEDDEDDGDGDDWGNSGEGRDAGDGDGFGIGDVVDGGNIV